MLALNFHRSSLGFLLAFRTSAACPKQLTLDPKRRRVGPPVNFLFLLQLKHSTIANAYSRSQVHAKLFPTLISRAARFPTSGSRRRYGPSEPQLQKSATMAGRCGLEMPTRSTAAPLAASPLAASPLRSDITCRFDTRRRAASACRRLAAARLSCGSCDEPGDTSTLHRRGSAAPRTPRKSTRQEVAAPSPDQNVSAETRARAHPRMRTALPQTDGISHGLGAPARLSRLSGRGRQPCRVPTRARPTRTATMRGDTCWTGCRGRVGAWAGAPASVRGHRTSAAGSCTVQAALGCALGRLLCRTCEPATSHSGPRGAAEAVSGNADDATAPRSRGWRRASRSGRGARAALVRCDEGATAACRYNMCHNPPCGQP